MKSIRWTDGVAGSESYYCPIVAGWPAPWDGFREWENELCECEPLACGRLDRRAARQLWQVEPMWYSVTALISRRPDHLEMTGGISPSLNPPPSVAKPPCRLLSFFVCFSFPPTLSAFVRIPRRPAHSLQSSFSLSSKVVASNSSPLLLLRGIYFSIRSRTAVWLPARRSGTVCESRRCGSVCLGMCGDELCLTGLALRGGLLWKIMCYMSGFQSAWVEYKKPLVACEGQIARD